MTGSLVFVISRNDAPKGQVTRNLNSGKQKHIKSCLALCAICFRPPAVRSDCVSFSPIYLLFLK